MANLKKRVREVGEMYIELCKAPDREYGACEVTTILRKVVYTILPAYLQNAYDVVARQGEITGPQLAAIMDVTDQNGYYYLRELRDVGLVEGERGDQGRTVYQITQED